MFTEINARCLARHRKSFKVDLFSLPSADEIATILATLGVSFRHRIFTPLVTLYGLLSQILSDDHSCRRVVVEINALRRSQRQKLCCFNTGSFVKAKGRLPLELLIHLTKKLSSVGDPAWRHGRVFVADGTGFAMPDSSANQEAYPHTSAKASFPVGHIVALFSLSTASLVDMAISPIVGKGSGELTLLSKLWNCLQTGDTLLADSLYSGFGVLASAKARGCYVVTEFKKMSHWRLKTNKLDQIIRIEKSRLKPHYVSEAEYKSHPDFLEVRVVKLNCAPKGFRAKTKFILTTHLDPAVTREDILDLYKRRWQVELNFRSIKTVLGMDVLTGTVPETVAKQVWGHMLAYNLIRTQMQKAALEKKLPPTSISFRAAQQLICLCRTLTACGGKACETIWEDLTVLLSTQLVGKRPDRYEPRLIKSRKKNFGFLSESRAAAKGRLHKKYKGKACA